LDEGIKKAATAARVGADATAQMSKAKAGRAAYVPEENLIGHKDPGAEAVARLFAAMENAV
jgi:dihydroxyacetone kinase